MKAVICEQYGPPEVLQFREIDKPVPKKDEVLIKMHASSVNAADCNTRGLTYIPSGLGLLARLMLGFNKPKISILGSVLAGKVEKVGGEVSSLKPGDRVYGTGPEMGAYAEYACRPEGGALAKIPDSLSYEEAASVPYGALTALYFLREKAGVKDGMKVLVHGASGGVGSYTVQLAKYFGAEVTGVCSTANVDYVKSLGADHVIDYTREDIRQSGRTWDVIFGGGAACEKKEYLEFLSELLERGELRPVLDKSYSFEQIVEAHRYVESGSKKGNVSIQIVQS